MATIFLPIMVPTLPAGYCYPATVQELLNKFGESTVQLSAGNFTLIVTSASTPAATDRDKFWKKPNDYRLYEYNSTYGVWVAEHLEAPSGEARRIFVGTTTTLLSYDGGDGTSTAPATAAGAMWEFDPAFAARFPVGVGTFPSTTTVAVLGTGGEEKHALIEAENASHTHIIDWTPPAGTAVSPASTILRPVGSGGNYDVNPGTTSDGGTLTAQTSGSGTAHNTLPPYIGVYVIRRTARVFYVG